MDIEGFIRNCDRVSRELPEYAVEIIEKNKKEILDIQESQILEGVRGDGKRTKKYKSDQYIKQKNKRSAKSFPYRNYFDTGDFLNGLFLYPNNDVAVIGSMDSKTSFLEDEEDGEMFGITKKNKPEIDKIIAPELINKVLYELFK